MGCLNLTSATLPLPSSTTLFVSWLSVRPCWRLGCLAGATVLLCEQWECEIVQLSDSSLCIRMLLFATFCSIGGGVSIDALTEPWILSSATQMCWVSFACLLSCLETWKAPYRDGDAPTIPRALQVSVLNEKCAHSSALTCKFSCKKTRERFKRGLAFLGSGQVKLDSRYSLQACTHYIRTATKLGAPIKKSDTEFEQRRKTGPTRYDTNVGAGKTTCDEKSVRGCIIKKFSCKLQNDNSQLFQLRRNSKRVWGLSSKFLCACDVPIANFYQLAPICRLSI